MLEGHLGHNLDECCLDVHPAPMVPYLPKVKFMGGASFRSGATFLGSQGDLSVKVGEDTQPINIAD